MRLKINWFSKYFFGEGLCVKVLKTSFKIFQEKLSKYGFNIEIIQGTNHRANILGTVPYFQVFLQNFVFICISCCFLSQCCGVISRYYRTKKKLPVYKNCELRHPRFLIKTAFLKSAETILGAGGAKPQN